MIQRRPLCVRTCGELGHFKSECEKAVEEQEEERNTNEGASFWDSVMVKGNAGSKKAGKENVVNG